MAGAMPPYDARRQTGSLRSSLRYDNRESLDHGDSGSGSDVTHGEWGIDAKHVRASPKEPVASPLRVVEETREEKPMTAKQPYERQNMVREKAEPEEELTGWALTKKTLDDNPRSLLLFHRDASFRKLCACISRHPKWNDFILFSIILNCLLMAFLYDPLDSSRNKKIREGFDIFFTFLFMLEMFIKIVAQGLLFADRAYLKDGWNIMDGSIVWVSFVCLEFVSGGVEGLGVVRAVRGIRPLRTLSRFKSGALFVNTLFTSWVYIWNVFVFLMWFIILAACSGTILFQGKLRNRCVLLPDDVVAAAGGDSAKASCPDDSVLTEDPIAYPVHLDEASDDPTVCEMSTQNCPADYTCCYYGKNAVVGDGKNRFDNILWSALITFQGLTVDGWEQTCNVLMDGLGWPVLLWYVLVVVFGAFFVMQLLSAVIITSLQTCSAEQELIEQLERERERKRAETRELDAISDSPVFAASAVTVGGAAATRNPTPRGVHPDESRVSTAPLTDFWESATMRPIRIACRLHIPYLFNLAETEAFNNAIVLMILANTIAMMTRHYPETETFAFAHEVMEWIFNAVFLLEFLIKHLGYGIAGYWSVGWNRLDGIIVISSIADAALSVFGARVELGFMRALRVLRVMRAVRVLKAAPEALAVMNAMTISLMNMGGYILVWFIFMLIYALLGTRLYGGACVFELDEDAGRLSFNSFARAMLTLFVIATGEDGFEVIHWTMDAAGNASALFVVSWMFISQIILSLLLALLIDTYSVDEEEEEEEEEAFSRDEIEARRSPRRETSSAPQTADAFGAFVKPRDGSEDADALFSKTRAGKSGKSGLSFRSSGRSLSAEQEQNQEKKLVAELESGDLTLEERAVCATRLETIRFLRAQRKQHEVALVRQWLCDVGLVGASELDGWTREPIAMTAEQEKQAKDRLSLKKHFKRKFGLGRRPNPAPHESKNYSALALGGALRVNFTEKGVRSSEGERARSDARSSRVKPRDEASGALHASPERPRNLPSEDSGAERGFAVAKFSEAEDSDAFHDADGAAYLDRGGKDDHRPELIRSVSAASSSNKSRVPSIPWNELKWNYRGTGWIAVTENAYFTNFILFAILWSSIMLALESPTYPAVGSKAEEVFFGINAFFTAVFTIEMALQWSALGLRGYFAANANRLDFIIVFTAWLSLILKISGVDAGTLTALRSLRLLRILRPLRAIRRLPALRMVVDCTLNALPAIKWIMVLGLFLATILGLFGMFFFGGQFWSCQFPPGVVDAFGSYSDNATTCASKYGNYVDRTLTPCENEAAAEAFGEPFASTVTECVMPTIVTQQECEFYNGTWANAVYNFDNIGHALVLVFITSTADNWQDAMYTGIDSVGIGKNLVYDNNLANGVFYVVLTMLSCFFWANMFVSMLVDQYTKASEAEGILTLNDVQRNENLKKALLLTKQQSARRKHWIDRDVGYGFTALCVRIASHAWFGRFMMGVIVLNGFVLTCLHADQPRWLDETEYISGIAFQILYCAEVVILMTAMTPSIYLEDPWNRFDVAIVAAGALELSVPGDAPWLAVLRTFRILRLCKIIKGMKELRILLYTIVSALPGVSNIGLLLFLLMFMYACLGVTMYGSVAAPFGFPDGLNEYVNFTSWPKAMFALFVMFTGNWEFIFRATYWRCEGGPDDWGRECAYDHSAPFYFFSYYVLANSVLGNLFVSIILDKFAATITADAGDETDLFSVVQIAHMLSVFSSMITQKIKIYQMLTGRLSKKRFEKARRLYGRFLPDWDGEVLSHAEAFAAVEGLKNARETMMRAYKNETIPESMKTREVRLDRNPSIATYSVIDASEHRLGERSERDSGRRIDRMDRSGKANPRSGGSDPSRDAARARRAETRDGNVDAHRSMPFTDEDDAYDSMDGDDFMSGAGWTPSTLGDPDARRGEKGKRREPQNWISSCSFIPGLEYCASAPPDL